MAAAGGKEEELEDKYIFVRGHSSYVREDSVEEEGVQFIPLVDPGYKCYAQDGFFEQLLDIVRDKDPSTIRTRIATLRNLSRPPGVEPGTFTRITTVNSTRNVTYNFYHEDGSTTQIGLFDLDELAKDPERDAINTLMYGTGDIPPGREMTLQQIVDYLVDKYPDNNLILVLGWV